MRAIRGGGALLAGGKAPRPRPKPIRPYRSYARSSEEGEGGGWKRLALRVGILLVIAVGAYFLFFHESGTDDEQIRRTVEEGRRLFEAKDLGAFMDLISEDYHDRSNFTKQTVKGILIHIFLASEPPRAEIGSIKASRSGDEALVTFEAKVSARGGDGAPSLQIGHEAPELITIRCRKEGEKMGIGGKWRVVESSGWEDADYQF